MKTSILLLILTLLWTGSNAQTDSLLLSLQSDSAARESLLPQKMIFTQRAFWGEHGLYRNLGWAPLTQEGREHELRLRRKMLVAHQILGFITLGGMIAQGIVGSKLYNGNDKLRNTHQAIAGMINATYGLTALMSLTAPPPMLNRDKGITSIRLHKWLALAHITGMVATNILAGQAHNDSKFRPYHRAAAYATFATFAAAVIVIKF